MNLLNLAPEIQEEILFLPRTTSGRDAMTKHDLRTVTAEPEWGGSGLNAKMGRGSQQGMDSALFEFAVINRDIHMIPGEMTEIFTAGYEGLDPKRLFALLHRCEVDMIVDVRELPVSRKKGFSKASLTEIASSNGLAYHHIPELGCPRQIRHEYREDKDWTSYTIRFKAYLRDQKHVLRELAHLASEIRICLLCFEEDFNFCHRTYVGEAVARFIPGAVRLSHLTGPMKGRVVVLEQAVAA